MVWARQGWREPAERRRRGCIVRVGATAWNQGVVVWPGPVGVDGFRDPDLLVWFGSASSGRFAIGRGWYRRDRARLGRKAQPPDGCIQGFQPGGLLPQLIDFFLDQLRSLFAPLSVAPHPQDFVLELFHPLLVQHDALLVTVITTPVQQLLRRSLRLRQK